MNEPSMHGRGGVGAPKLDMFAPLPGPAPEVEVTKDISRRGLMVAPVVIAICAVIWGGNGAWSAAYGLGLVILNFVLAGAIITVTARISFGLMMGGIMFGYLLRLGLIVGAVWLVKDAAWISLPALGATIIVTHLGLLAWELKYVSMSLAHPGLKPKDAPSAQQTPSPSPSVDESPAQPPVASSAQ